MKLSTRTATLVATALAYGQLLVAQTPDSTARRQQRTLDSLTAALRVMQARIDSLSRARGRGDTTVVDELAALRAAATAASGDSAAAARPQQQPRLGANAMNPEISVSGDFRANYYSPGPQTDNFVPREFEIGFQSALDPFSTAKVFVSIEDGQVGLEEGYLYFTALPGHLRLDLGQFRQLVGELNRWHLHALYEDEYPLVIRTYGSDDGIVGPGASVYWPLPFSGKAGAYELTMQVTSGVNDVLFAGGRRPAVNAQLSGFWQFSRSTYAQVSLSGMYGTNPDTSLTTTLGVAAARFSWRPPQQGQAKEFTIRSELWALRRNFALVGPNAFDATRLGGYVDATWKLNRRWTTALRYDRVESPDPGITGTAWAITPALTYWQSEFVYLRAQFEHLRTALNTNADRITMQVVFAMGPHKHELF